MKAFLEYKFLGLEMTNYLFAALFFLIAFTLKKYLSKVLSKIVFKLFRRFADTGYVQKFQDIVLQPFQALIVSVSFYVGFLCVSPLLDRLNIYSRIKSGASAATVVSVMDIIDVLFYLSLIITLTLLVSRIIEFVFLVLIDGFKERNDKERQQIFPLIKDMLSVLLWCICIFTILGSVFKVNVGALIAGMGIGGLAIAFAAKDSLENLISSIMIMLDRPFMIGDWVKVGGVEGTVEKLGFRSTHVRTFDKSLITLPNRKLLEGSLENFTERGTRRVKFDIGAVYGLSEDTLRKVMHIIVEQIEEHPGVSGRPTINFDNFGDSSINFTLIYFVIVDEEVSFLKVKEDVNFIVYNVMYQYAQGFPYPTQTQIQGVEINEVNS